MNNPTAFQTAVREGELEKVKALLGDNPDLIFSKDNYGQTPLHVAALKGHKDVAELLLSSKAEVNAKNKDGDTPLHLAAATEGHKDVVELLLANKAEVDARANDGTRPLHLAAAEGHRDVVELLLASKAKVNAKDKHGDTPLHCAAEKGHEDVADLLRQHSGDEPTDVEKKLWGKLTPYGQKEFEKIADSKEEYTGKWNWAAFFFTGLWALYHGLWGWFFLTVAIYLVIHVVGVLVGLAGFPFLGLILQLIWMSVFGAKGTFWLYSKVRRDLDRQRAGRG